MIDGIARKRSKLFEKHVRLFDGYVYERDAYDKRPGCDPS